MEFTPWYLIVKEDRMKKFSVLLSGIILLTYIGAVFAKPQQDCPTLQSLRDIGSHFTNAYDIGNSSWVLVSDLYHIGADIWQTTFYTIIIPSNVDSEKALAIGQSQFTILQLRTKPERAVYGPQINCRFDPEGAPFVVVAQNAL